MSERSLLQVGIAVASWNQAITDRLLDGATKRCEEIGVEQVLIVRVPGALELPLAAQALVRKGCDAVVAIGVVIKGETDHYEIVARESSSGLTRVGLDTGVPIGNAILAVHSYEQALDRAGDGEANKGVEATEAALAMVNALKDLEQA